MPSTEALTTISTIKSPLTTASRATSPVAANFDETHFSNPERFDATRHPNEHVAFGFGTHYCLGQALARVELNVMFERLLSRLPDMKLAG